MLRTISSLALLMLLGCGESFYSVQQADTIEAYERYLAESSPSRSQREMAEQRLEYLYLEAAKAEGTLEAYDAFLERYPEGQFKTDALAEREGSLYDHTVQQDTPEAWKRFLDEYPKAAPDRVRKAKRSLVVAGYRDHVTISEPVIADVNLAENPKGPMDGVGFTAQVTNTGDKTLSSIALTMSYLGEDGKPVDTKEWPLVSNSWQIPMPDEAKAPMKPGDTRTWSWSEAKERLPKSYAGKVSLRLSAVGFAD